MKTVIAWLNEALASKDIGAGMTYYRVKDKTISATNGNIVASHPWTFGKDEFLVPGKEFEKVLSRMTEAPIISLNKDGELILKSGRFRGTVQTLPLTEWDYPGVAGAKWQKLPADLIKLIKALQPFISDNASQAWATCIALKTGWAYATNNIAIAGGACKGLEKVDAMLPMWAVEFILSRVEGLKEWTYNNNFIAFRWDSGAWMRSQLIVGQFPERAAEMVRQSIKAKTTQKIDDKFREVIERIGDLAEDTVLIYAKRIEARFGKAVVEDGVVCEIPKDADCSIFAAKVLLPAINAADSWSPSTWPNPTPFRGPVVSGYVVGRRA